ncbi:MAG: hypothetical protein WEB88_14035 [Gemmatimonadota bacterium]
MLTIRLDPGRLSTAELTNLGRALRQRCAACIEADVPGPCRHEADVRWVLDLVADAVEREAHQRQRRRAAESLAVDPASGEWGAGA